MLNRPNTFREVLLKATLGGRATGCVTFFSLVGGEVTGWCFRSLSHQPGSDQSGVCVLVLSLKLPSSTWVGTLVPVEELKDMYQIVMYIPRGGALPYYYTLLS